MDELKTIVVVEDNPSEARLTIQCIHRSSQTPVTIHHCETLGEAISLSRDVEVDAFLLDLGLPDNEGLDGITRLTIASPDSAIVVFTGSYTEENALAGIRMGAQLYVDKQDVAGRRDVLIRILRQACARQKQLLEAVSQAHVDPLTGIANRRALSAELQRRVADFRRHGAPFSLIMFDVDHFKSINDQFGHIVGDKVLTQIARLLQRNSRSTDLCVRYGGEEFVLVLPLSQIDEAWDLAERIRQQVPFEFDGILPQGRQVTVSGGLAEVEGDDSMTSIVRRADLAMYQAKHGGRNQCLAYQRFFDTCQLTESKNPVPSSQCSL
ncbi:diguanylate cyclase [bacterium]|nr:diguanylate cyclase [bacterium]